VSDVLTTSLHYIIDWARSQSLWYINVGGGCCASEIFSSQGCRYDLERFGCLEQWVPEKADLLIVSSVVNEALGLEIKKIYDRMAEPKYVMSVGSCSNCGGAFGEDVSYSVKGGVDRFIPVDVFVSGCPPRPEAIMHGLIQLQEMIKNGIKSDS